MTPENQVEFQIVTLIQEGKVVKRMASHRTYTYREICELLEASGFVDVRAHGSLKEEPFRLGSETLLLVANKKTN